MAGATLQRVCPIHRNGNPGQEYCELPRADFSATTMSPMPAVGPAQECRHCKTPLALQFVDLGTAPPSNAYLNATAIKAAETWYPLSVYVCDHCWLVQTADCVSELDLFNSGYAYFSGFSETWLNHCRLYVQTIIDRLGLNAESHVVEVAANDGHLLQYFSARDIPCMGVEPTASTAAAAKAKGLKIVEQFFGSSLATSLAEQGRCADLIVANNVLAHVPDINDFVAGVADLLKPSGVATFEFPHLLQLIRQNQFDTIYHEHFSYLSLLAVQRIFNANGLSVFDVEHITTHGGSLRVFAQRRRDGIMVRTEKVDQVLRSEYGAKLHEPAGYSPFQAAAEQVKDQFLGYLLECKRQGKRVAGYGAAAKGNTLLNFAGIRSDLIAFVADRNPAKQGCFAPGSRIPILPEAALAEFKPDVIVLLPWNLRSELISQLEYARGWGAHFLTAVPTLQIA